jgi:hypothetical protein
MRKYKKKLSLGNTKSEGLEFTPALNNHGNGELRADVNAPTFFTAFFSRVIVRLSTVVTAVSSKLQIARHRNLYFKEEHLNIALVGASCSA